MALEARGINPFSLTPSDNLFYCKTVRLHFYHVLLTIKSPNSGADRVLFGTPSQAHQPAHSF